MTKMKGGGALVEMLRRHGVETIFALPGVQNDALFVAFYDAGDALRVIHTRHEQGAAYMAFGYARASGKIGTYAVVDDARYRVFRVPATDIAIELGNELVGSMVMTGAYVGVTGLVGLDATVEAMRRSIPPYRRQHIAANEEAIRAGFAAVDRLAFPAWEQEPARA